jgi:hypothetical protein
VSVEGGFLQETRESKVDIRFQSTILSRLLSFCNRNKSMIGLLVSAILTVSLASLYYLQTMCRWTYAGFPLDDSWIHIEFARSIFEGRPWEYSPGWPSTGSTSPLWAILLSSLFFIATDSTSLILYTYILSGILYVASAFLAGLIVYDYTDSNLWAQIAIIGFVLTPRGTWLMMSGMESPLFIFLILLGIYFVDRPGWRYDLFIGIIGGFLFLTRPEGLLFLLVGIPLRFLLTAKQRELNLKRLLSFGGAILVTSIIAAPWIFYCLSVTHLPLPDTFYAKSGHITPSSITIWNEFWIKTFIESPFTIIGIFGGFLLILKGKPCAWVFSIAMLFTYFETIPYAVLVNNARYMTPLIFILIIVCVIVVGMLTDTIRTHHPTLKSELSSSIIATTMILLILIPTIPLFVEQANFFGNSVKNINEMQVTIGQWIFENTPPDAKFAIFDAGAIRFFGNRTVFDMAHLVTPELAHGNFTITETFQWLRDHGCNYTVSWRDWFRLIAIILNLPYTELFGIVLNDNVICAGPEMSVFSLNWNQSTIWSASNLD